MLDMAASAKVKISAELWIAGSMVGSIGYLLNLDHTP